MMSQNKTMMQYFEWYLPNDGLWWKRCAAKAENLAALGITGVWLPPAYKGTSQEGVPCVFYSDYYGNPVKNRPLVPNLGKLIKLRRAYAYGEQIDRFENEHLIGWVRRGDGEHESSGLAVVMSNAGGGTLPMYIGEEYAGESFYDVLGNCPEPVTIDENGSGDFRTVGGSVSVWVRKPAFEDLVVNE